VQDLQVEELLAEFFSLEEAGDLFDEVTGVSQPDPLPPPQKSQALKTGFLRNSTRNGSPRTNCSERDGWAHRACD